MTRPEWLSKLQAGDAVLLRTQLPTFPEVIPAVVHRRDGKRIWVTFPTGAAYIHHAVWVDSMTGVIPQTHIAILPPPEHVTADAREDVKTGEFGALR